MPLVLNISENTVEAAIITPLALLFSLSFEQRKFRKIEIKLIIAPDGEPRIMQTNPLKVICTDWSSRATFFDCIKPLAVVREQAKKDIMFPISTVFDNNEIILTSRKFTVCPYPHIFSVLSAKKHKYMNLTIFYREIYYSFF